jgi:alginate O-acetyltransferase complex protein AlgI
MVFSSIQFLFFFLPIALLLIFLSPAKLKNLTLLLLSLFFYAYGEGIFVVVMLFSIVLNYFMGMWIGQKTAKQKTILGFGIAVNLLLILVFKYANFIVDNFNILLSQLNISPIALTKVHLPIGISFFTFQAISYLIDVYRGDAKAQRSVINFGMYKSLFPQLIAGPIVRYADISNQIQDRKYNTERIYLGVKRFMLGLAKKILLANTFGEVADHVFGLSPGDIGTPLAWLGIISYALQIYFDFSGYSDMAIGLGKILGFDFLENFNFPYISRSIQEFWRRWHISLSSWFRDYLYIPLGGNRVGKYRLYINLIIVFFLTGLWHGASWNFIIWGLFHGMFLIIERLGFAKILNTLPKVIQHSYVLLTILISWVFFRADNLTNALQYLESMFVFRNSAFSMGQFIFLTDAEFWIVLIFGLILSTPIKDYCNNFISKHPIHFNWSYIHTAFVFFTFILSIIYLSAGTYNPFIYFRF